MRILSVLSELGVGVAVEGLGVNGFRLGVAV